MYIFLILILVISIYVAARLTWPLPIRWPFKLIGACLLLLIGQQHLLYRFLFGGLSSPALPAPLLLVLLWLFIALLIASFLFLVHDLAGGLFWLIRRAGLPLSLPWLLWQRTGVLAILALIISTYGLWQGLRVPDVRMQEVSLQSLPRELDGLKVVQLTDLHISLLLNRERMEKIVERTNALQADFILITGDIVDGKVAERRAAIEPLARLRARHGVFSCLGNHEYYSEWPGWLLMFEELGLHMLRNSHQLVEVKGQPVVIAGITDPVAERDAKYGPMPDIRAALEGAPADALSILMAHQPGTARQNAEAGIDLQLSGHTHGGHVRGIDLLVQRANKGFVRDFYQVEQMLLYVSPGAGLWTGFPVRLGVPSEITCLVLRSAAPQAQNTTRTSS